MGSPRACQSGSPRLAVASAPGQGMDVWPGGGGACSHRRAGWQTGTAPTGRRGGSLESGLALVCGGLARAIRGLRAGSAGTRARDGSACRLAGAATRRLTCLAATDTDHRIDRRTGRGDRLARLYVAAAPITVEPAVGERATWCGLVRLALAAAMDSRCATGKSVGSPLDPATD